MTVITVATIGYGETHPLSHAGRVFTIILILTGVAVVTGVFAHITQKVIQSQFINVFSQRRMMEAIKKLSNHTIVCGYGRLSRIAAQELAQAKTDVVVVEKDPILAQLARDHNHYVVEGDALRDETLIKAGIKKARHLVSLLSKDADNLYLILASRELAPSLYVLTRAEDDSGEKRLRRAGADKIIAPYRVGGLKIAEGLLRPYVTDFLEIAASSSNTSLQIEQIQIPEDSPLEGSTLQDAELRQKTNVIVAAIISEKGEMVFNPAASAVIEAGSTFIALGTRDDLKTLEEIVIGK